MNKNVEEHAIGDVDAPLRIRSIFLAFLELGCTAFGGPAIIAHIRELVVHRKKWLDDDAFKDGVVLSQAIPGATAMQVAAYVGLKARGGWGAAAAYVGLGLPAFLLMLLLSEFYTASRSITPIVALFGGLQVLVVAIVAQSAFSFSTDIIRSVRCTGLAVASATLLMYGISPFIVIVGSAAAGAVLFRDIVLDASPAKELRMQQVKRTLLVGGGAILAGLVVLYFVNYQLFTLSTLMLRINFFAFGGGLSSLPLMHHEIVSRGWLDSRAFMDGIALGQVTPGPISITGTFIGYLLFGITGAIVATIATFTPSFLLLLAADPCFEALKSSRTFAMLSKGILSCFVGLLVYVTYRFAHDIPWDGVRALLGVAAFLALLKKVDILLIVLIGAIYSVVLL